MNDAPVAYSLRTPRLLLRCLGPEDVLPRKAAVDESGEHLRAFSFSALSLDQHLAAVRRARSQFDSDGDRIYGAFERLETGAEGPLVGEGALLRRAGLGALELGYWVRQSRTSRGYGTELAAALVWCAFRIDRIVRVDLLCAPDNAPSAAIARRLGFTFEGTLRSRQLMPHHDRGDLSVFSLLDRELEGTAAARGNVEAYDFLGRPLAPLR